MIYSVWAIDPGARTGWAWAVCSSRELRRADPLQLLPQLAAQRRFTAGELTSPVGYTVKKLVKLFVKVDATVQLRWPGWQYRKVLVKEGFLDGPRAKSSNKLLPSRVNAALDQAVGSWFDETHEQMPSAKAVVSDDRLKRHGLWLPGKPHAMDGVRHLTVRLRMLSQ